MGTAFFVSNLAPDLSTVRFARYAANFIPRTPPSWPTWTTPTTTSASGSPQPDFRIPERISPGFGPFPDLELEAMYEDQVRLVRGLSGAHGPAPSRPTPTPTWS